MKATGGGPVKVSRRCRIAVEIEVGLYAAGDRDEQGD